MFNAGCLYFSMPCATATKIKRKQEHRKGILTEQIRSSCFGIIITIYNLFLRKEATDQQHVPMMSLWNINGEIIMFLLKHTLFIYLLWKYIGKKMETICGESAKFNW